MKTKENGCIIKICVDADGNITPSLDGTCAPGEFEKAIDACMSKGINFGPMYLEERRKRRVEEEKKEKENDTE